MRDNAYDDARANLLSMGPMSLETVILQYEWVSSLQELPDDVIDDTVEHVVCFIKRYSLISLGSYGGGVEVNAVVDGSAV